MTQALTETRVATLEANYTALKDDTTEIKGDVREIRRELKGRPSWPVAFALTFLSSLTVGLVTLVGLR